MVKDKYQVGILGLGWIGLPLAKQLQKNGIKVVGSTTSSEKAAQLQQQGIDAQVVKLLANAKPEGLVPLLASDVLVVCIPPKIASEGPDFHPAQVAQLCAVLPEHIRVVYTGSTGVFANHPGETVDEDTQPKLLTDRALALGKAENTLHQHLGDRLTILRFGGLMGADRIPGRMAQTKPVRNPEDRVNFVHRDDAIGMLMAVLKQEAWGHTLHAIAPVPATRCEVYQAAAEQGGWPSPSFSAHQTEPGHVVLGEKSTSLLKYDFLHPDPRYFSYTDR